MGRPRQVSDREILDAARQCFLEHGPGVSTTRIAHEVGVSQPALFKRFKSKQTLLLAAMDMSEHVAWFAELGNGPDDRDFSTQLEELVGQLWVSVQGMMPRIAVLRASGIGHEEMLGREKVFPPDKIASSIAAWLDSAQARGLVRHMDTSHVASILMGALHSRAFVKHVLRQPSADPSDAEFLATLVDLLGQGIAPKTQP